MAVLWQFLAGKKQSVDFLYISYKYFIRYIYEIELRIFFVKVGLSQNSEGLNSEKKASLPEKKTKSRKL